MSTVRKFSSTGIFAVVLAYAVLAALWILLSDRAMGLLFSDPAALVQASMLKGWFFVAVTSVLLYVLVRWLVRLLDAAHRRELDFERAQKQPPPMLVAIVDASSDAIFAKDDEGRYLLFNNAAARFVGKSVDEVIGKDDRALFPAAQAGLIMAIDGRVRLSGQAETNEELVDTTVGKRTFLATKGPLFGSDGRLFGTYGISRDITERKQAERLLHDSQERLRLLVDHAPAALAMFDEEMRYLEVSRRWCDDYSLGDMDIIGRSHYEIFPEISEHWRAVHRRGRAAGAVRYVVCR